MDEEKKQKKSKDAEIEDGEKSESDEEEDDITPAKILNDKIIKAADLGEYAGDVIASFTELPLIIPRGKYTLDLYSNFAKLHGRTHDYKIMFSDIAKGFLLPKPDTVHMAYVLQLKTPLR